jgi:hypothetical protein
MTKSKCQWCGEAFAAAHPTKMFCSNEHRNAFGNYMASRGKILMPIALAWRSTRGRKGSGGDEAFAEMVELLDRCVAELHEQGAQPIIKHFRKCRSPGVGVTRYRDTSRVRPSRVDRNVEEAQ